jgi:hypothetical protein
MVAARKVAESTIAMVRRFAPVSEIVKGSTPVVYFGNPLHARVATLGINPSRKEFIENGRLLSGAKRRLATLRSLEAKSLARLTSEQVRTVVQECASYFTRNPYRRWFDPLDCLLRDALEVSYYDGTACHLDLVQWATDPVWSGLSPAVRNALLNDGRPHLQKLLNSAKIRLVVLNGKQVLDQLEKTGLAIIESDEETELAETKVHLSSGRIGRVRFVGWSRNLQGNFGITNSFRSELARWVARQSNL